MPRSQATRFQPCSEARRIKGSDAAARVGQLPAIAASKFAGADLGEVFVLDVEATFGDRARGEGGGPLHVQGLVGFQPIAVWVDKLSEMLAVTLRSGNVGANATADHIEVMTAAIAQIPAAHRRKLLVRADGAGATHMFQDRLTDRGQIRGRALEFWDGFAVTEAVRAGAGLRVPARGRVRGVVGRGPPSLLSGLGGGR